MTVVELTKRAADPRGSPYGQPSRAACWECGLRESATIHGSDVWWQHRFVPAILTKAR